MDPRNSEHATPPSLSSPQERTDVCTIRLRPNQSVNIAEQLQQSCRQYQSDHNTESIVKDALCSDAVVGKGAHATPIVLSSHHSVQSHHGHNPRCIIHLNLE